VSWKISGLVWELELTHSQQSVLLALADHAEHDGSKVFPSVARISWKTGYSDRQVRRVMSELRNMKILILTKEANRYRPREYKIDILAGKKKQPFRGDTVSSLGGKEESAPTSRADMGISPEASDLTPASTRTDIAASTRGDIAMSPRNIIKSHLNTNDKDSISLSQDNWVQALIAIKQDYYRGRHTAFDRNWGDTGYVGKQDGRFIVTCRDDEQHAWLTDHGKKTAENMLVGILGGKVEVEFVMEES